MPEREDFELYLDAYEISRLETMSRAAVIMDEHDEEEGVEEYGNKATAPELG